MTHEDLAVRGRSDAARVALEQRHLERFLEASEEGRGSRLGHTGGGCRAYHRARVVQLRQFVEYAPPSSSLDDQLALVSALALDPRLDVPDPAGGNQADYEAVARSLWDLARRFAQLVDQ